MITVSVTKRAGLTASFQRSFESVSDAATFAQLWVGFHVTTVNGDGQPIDLGAMLRASREPALRPFTDAKGAPLHCPFCGAPEATILADDDLLHACDTCDRAWYIDETGNVLPADRCPVCESPDVYADDRGVIVCRACGHKAFFDGLTYVDPATVQAEESEVSS